MKSTHIHSDPDIMGGTPVFVGSRVPVRILFEHLEAGDPLEVFLEVFPTVSLAVAVKCLKTQKPHWSKMHILLDESVPEKLGKLLVGHSYITVQQ